MWWTSDRRGFDFGVRAYGLVSCEGERRTAGPSASSGFPVDVSGVGELHAAFFTESRTRGHIQGSVVGNPEFARDDKGRAVTFTKTVRSDGQKRNHSSATAAPDFFRGQW
jgi:hypothetical protein